MSGADEMGKKVVFAIKYDGTSEAIQNHTMEARELATALMAFDDLFKRANELINGVDSKVSVVVKGSFKAGSFEIYLEAIQSLWQSAKGLVASDNAVALTTTGALLGLMLGSENTSVLAILRWLKNRKIFKIEDKERKTKIITEDNDELEFDSNIAKILQDYKARKSIEDIVAPLSTHGEIHNLYIVQNGDVIQHIEQKEAPVFAAPPRETKIEQIDYENTYDATVELVTIFLKEDGKWRFKNSEDALEFNATVEDEQFIRRVQQSKVRFAKGDKLNVRLRVCIGKRQGGRKYTEHFIEQVLEHIEFPVAPDMF